MKNIDFWIWAVRVTYLTCLPVWYSCAKRRRYDLLLIAIFIYTVSLVHFENTRYMFGHHGSNPGWLFELVIGIDTVKDFAITWGVTVVLIYSCAFVSVTHERVFYFVTFNLLFLIHTVQISRQMLIGSRICVSVPMMLFFFYQGLLRSVFTYINAAFALAGYTLFYSGFAVSYMSTLVVNSTAVCKIHVLWLLFTNAGLFLIIISVPPERKIKVVAGSEHRYN
jgi:hypothetical protein